MPCFCGSAQGTLDGCEHCGSPEEVRARKVYRLDHRPLATRIPLCAACWESERRREIVRLVLEARLKA